MRNGMQWILNKLKSSFFLRVSLVYALSAWIILQVVNLTVSYFELPAKFASVIAEVAVINFFIVILLSWVIGKVSVPDRRLLIVAFVWTFGPLYLTFNILLFVAGIFLGYPSETGESPTLSMLLSHIAAVGLSGVIGFMWAQISIPFARAWLLRKAEYPNSISKLFQFGNRRATPEEAREAEAHISPKLYYTFLAMILAVIFLLVETFLSEFLDDTFGSVDYIGASFIAICIAITVYPIHKRASRYVSFSLESDANWVATDFKSAVLEVTRAFVFILKDAVRTWYITIPLGIIVLIIVVLIIDHASDLLLF